MPPLLASGAVYQRINTQAEYKAMLAKKITAKHSPTKQWITRHQIDTALEKTAKKNDEKKKNKSKKNNNPAPAIIPIPVKKLLKTPIHTQQVNKAYVPQRSPAAPIVGCPAAKRRRIAQDLEILEQLKIDQATAHALGAASTSEDSADDSVYPIHVHPRYGACKRQLTNVAGDRFYEAKDTWSYLKRLKQRACPRDPALPHCDPTAPRTNYIYQKNGVRRRSSITSRFRVGKKPKEFRASSRPMHAYKHQAMPDPSDPIQPRELVLTPKKAPRGRGSRDTWKKHTLGISAKDYNCKYPGKRRQNTNAQSMS
jgi:hypothetical protein